MKRFFLVMMVFVAFITMNAQEDFVGRIVFDIKIDAEEMDPQVKAMMPKEVTVYMDKDKICTEQKTMFSNQKVIINSQDKMLWILMGMMGQNIAIHSTFDEMLEDVDDDGVQLKYLDDYKTIAGYKCQKVIVDDEESVTYAYITNEIKGFENMYLDNPIYNQMKGFILESSTEVEGMTMLMTAREVKKEDIDSSIFEISDTYQKMTMEEFQSMMKGMY